MLAQECLERPLGRAVELPLGLEMETPRGTCWRIDAPVEELWPEQERWLAALRKRGPAEAAELPHPELAALRESLPHRAALLAVEMAGPIGNTLFLVTALHAHKQLPVVTQLLARGDAEEGALLSALDGIIDDKDCLITFNGKASDWPTVLERRLTHGFGAEPRRLVHCDLLYHARRRWKSRLPNCKLQTLEQYVCGRHRSARFFERDAADAYRTLAHSGDAAALRTTLHHTALDVVTMWQLALWLAHA
jgi:hypothetical protein